MIAQRVFAQILDGTVINAIVCNDGYEIASQIARLVHGEDAIAIDITDVPVHQGDTYEDGIFYRDGEEVKKVESQEKQLLDLEDAFNLQKVDYENQLDGVRVEYEHKLTAVKEEYDNKLVETGNQLTNYKLDLAETQVDLDVRMCMLELGLI